MRIALLAALFTAVVAMPSLAGEAKQDFALVNKTGYELKEIYVSPGRADDWGDDVMGTETVPDGAVVNIKMHRAGKTCDWDLKVVYEIDDSSAVWNDIDLCSISRITIRYNKDTDKTTAIYE